MEEYAVAPKWIVLARHLSMPGGISDYGTADIKEICGSFAEADKYARTLFEGTRERLIAPYVWVLRCEKTYTEGGIFVSQQDRHPEAADKDARGDG